MSIGGHGAGMTNMVFAPDDVSIVEFALQPQCSRIFGYISLALGLDYWLVPQISSFYHLQYEMDHDKAELVVRLVRLILVRKGFSWLLRN
jgi:hypothetical protein